MRGRAALLASLGLAFPAAPAQADPGDLAWTYASSFQTQFPSDRQQEAAVDSQGRIVLAATRVDAQNREHLDILRVTPHGDLDTSFGHGGVVEVDFSNEAPWRAGSDVEARGVAVVAGDAVVALSVIGPNFASGRAIGLVRLTSDGDYDPALTGDGRLATAQLGDVGPYPEALAVDGAGRMIVAGSQDCHCAQEAFVARFSPDGALDTAGFDAGDALHPGVLTFGTGNTQMFDLALTAGGKILAAGAFDTDANAVIARIRGDGTLDATFGQDGVVSSGLGKNAGEVAEALGVAPGPGGSVYVGGEASESPTLRMRVLRLTEAGAPDPAFGTAGVADVPGATRGWTVATDGSGCPVVAGYASHGLREDLVLARLTTGGVLDEGFGSGGVTAVPAADPPGSSDHAQGETVAFAGADPVVAGFRRADGDLASTRALVLRFAGGGAVCGAPPGGGGGGGGGGGQGGGGSGGGQTGGGGATLPVPRFTIGERAALPHALAFNAAATSVAPGASVTDYIWDTDGNGTYDWQCGRSPVFAEGFRTAAGQHTIGLRVVDSLGNSADARLRVDVPASAVNHASVDRNVVDCENPAAGDQADRGDCIKSFGFGIIDVNSRGDRGDCFQLTSRSAVAHISQAPPATRKAVFYYHAKLRGPLAINGLYVPLPESVTSDFDSGDQTIDVGRVDVDLGPFTTQPLDLRKRTVTPKKGVYHVDDVLLSGANAALGALPVKGNVSIDLVNRASATTVSVGLPKPFSLDPSSGKGTQGAVTFRSDNVHGVSFDGVKVKFDAYLGALTLRNAQLTYSKSKDIWSGGADIYLPGSEAGLSPIGINAAPPPPDLGFGLKGGAFDHAGIGLNFFGAARPEVFPGIFLTNIHVAFGVGPFRLTGGLGVSVGDVVDIDGDVFIAFASPGQSYDFPDKDAAGDLAPLAGRTLDSFTIALGGTGSLDLPVVGKVALAHAYGIYEYPDFFEAGAGFSLNMVLVKVDGDLHGFVLPSAGKFSFDAQVNACPDFDVDLPVVGDVTIDKPCFGAGAAISTVGAGICGTIPIPFVTGAIPVTITVGYKWSGSVGVALFTCDLSPYTEANPRAAQAGRPWSFTLPSGLPSAMVRVRGTGDFTLTGPGGTSIATAAPPNDTGVVILRQAGTTSIALKRPAGGRWSVAGPGVTDVASAQGLPAPHIRARVSGHGSARTLTYALVAEPGRKVTFAERGPRTFRILGTAHGARGRLRFTSAGGRPGRRAIVARVTENGIDHPSVVVAHYSAPAPKPAAPRHLRARHRGSKLTVTWHRVAGAGSYSVVVSTHDGHRTLTFVTRPRVTLPVAASAHGTVQVAVERPGVRHRATATVRFRASR